MNADYELAYVSTFTSIITSLKDDYDIKVEIGDCNNYNINIIRVNEKIIDKYLSICFQKQNATLTFMYDKSENKKIISKIIDDISTTLNLNFFATYNLKNYKNYNIIQWNYKVNNPIINNKNVLDSLEQLKEITNLKYN